MYGIETAYKKLKSRGVLFVGITAEAESTVEAFLRRKSAGITFPCAVDASGTIARACGIMSTPEARIVYKGKVLWSGEASGTSIEKAVRAVLFENSEGRSKQDGKRKRA